MNGQTRKTINLPLPGGATAVYDTTFHYRYGDWLGSSRFSSTASRTKFSDDAYAPYGENYAESGTVDPSFTGNDQDTVSGTYDFLFREYNANQGRWISPDPAGLTAVHPSNPQTWNRYAYVANNPLSFTDPLGLLLSDCVSCNFFNNALSAVNQTINWSVEAQTRDFFGDKYYDLPGNNNQIASGKFSYFQGEYGANNVAAGTNGFTISFYVNFWTNCSKDAPSGCIGRDSINLFQFLDPTETKSFSLGTSFGNTVAAFGRSGIVPSQLDNRYNIWHPAGSFHLRDSSPVCSAHVVLDSGAGQAPTTGSVHLDGFNPNSYLLGHGAADLLPYEIRKWTGLPIPGGSSFCQ